MSSIENAEFVDAMWEPGVLPQAPDGSLGCPIDQFHLFGTDNYALQLFPCGFPEQAPASGFEFGLDCSQFDPALFLDIEKLNQHPSAHEEGHTADVPPPYTPPESPSLLSPQSPSTPSLISSPMSPPETPSPASPPADLTPQWDYDDLIENVVYSPELLQALHEIFLTIAHGNQPSKAQVRMFMILRRGRHYCAVKNCKWHTIGWKREDRGVTHFLKEHLRLLAYPCDQCELVYKWPHDLTAHQRRHHDNVPQQNFVCDECGNGFPKSFNLSRHKRNVHRPSKKNRAMRGAC